MNTTPPAAHHRSIFTRLFVPTLLLVLAANGCWAAAGELKHLRTELERAEETEDRPAIAELCRRIVAIKPNDEQAWDTLVDTELQLEDLDRAERSLGRWAKAIRKPSAGIEDLWGNLLFKREDYQGAARHWLAYLSRKPDPEDAAIVCDKLADLCATHGRWAEFASYSGKAVAADDSASRRTTHALALLHLHQWDAALAEIHKAREVDPADAALKETLPKFERLQKVLPQLKAVDAQIAKSPNSAGFLVDRARLLSVSQFPEVAVQDARQAMTLQPAWMRARILTGEALLDQKKPEAAAELKVSPNLVRGGDGHVSDRALRELAEEDAGLWRDRQNAELLAQRSRTLRSLNQYVLALEDANAALAIGDNSANAHVEAALSLNQLDRTREALDQATRATELSPQNESAWFARGLIEGARADLYAAVASQTHALALRESLAALREREKCAREIGQIELADRDAKRIRELEEGKR